MQTCIFKAVSLRAKRCWREDLAPSLAVDVSLSHLTAIVVPIFGAALGRIRLPVPIPLRHDLHFLFSLFQPENRRTAAANRRMRSVSFAR
jgi:hypothetical protein